MFDLRNAPKWVKFMAYHRAKITTGHYEILLHPHINREGEYTRGKIKVFNKRTEVVLTSGDYDSDQLVYEMIK